MHQTRRIRASSRAAQSRFAERRKTLRLAALLPWAVLAAGCGQRGPLYHPPELDEEDEEDGDETTSAVPAVPDSRLG